MATRHVKGITPVEIAADDNLTTRLWERASSDPDTEIISYHTGSAWRQMTWGQLGERVRAIAAGLIALGVEPGDRVALMAPRASSGRSQTSRSCPPVGSPSRSTRRARPTSARGSCRTPLRSTPSPGDADHAKNLDAARSSAKGLGEIFILADGGLDSIAERASSEDLDKVAACAAGMTTDDLATLIYTSGHDRQPEGLRAHPRQHALRHPPGRVEPAQDARG
jgi:long-chain acyl-CoA synthetase